MSRWRTTILMLACLGFMTTGTSLASDEDVVRTTLQDRISEYPILPLNTDRHRARYTLQELNVRAFKLGDKYYDAIAFKTPKTLGEFVWSYVPVERESYWQIVPAEGTMEGFTKMTSARIHRNIDGVGYTGQPAVFQRLPAKQLRPNSVYLIWFSFRHTDPVTVPISLNMFTEPDLEFKDILPDAFGGGSTELDRADIETHRRLLQEHTDDFQSIYPATDVRESGYKPVTLNTNPLNIGQGYTDARVFKVPQAGGELTLSLVPPRNLAGWMIVPVEGDGLVLNEHGAHMRHFTKALAGVPEDLNTVVFQRAPSARLVPGKHYIIAFRFADVSTTDVPVSLNLFTQPGVPYSQILPDAWAASAYEMTWDVLQVAGWKLQPNIDLRERVDLYMQLKDPKAWLRSRNNEFELREIRARFLKMMQSEIDRFDTSSQVLVRPDYEFDVYDFSRGCFPLKPVSGWMSVKDTLATFAVYKKHQGTSLTKRLVTCREIPEMQCLTMPEDKAKQFLGRRTGPDGNVDRTVYAELGMVILGLQGKDERKLRGQITSVRIYSDPQRTILIQQN